MFYCNDKRTTDLPEARPLSLLCCFSLMTLSLPNDNFLMEMYPAAFDVHSAIVCCVVFCCTDNICCYFTRYLPCTETHLNYRRKFNSSLQSWRTWVNVRFHHATYRLCFTARVKQPIVTSNPNNDKVLPCLYSVNNKMTYSDKLRKNTTHQCGVQI